MQGGAAGIQMAELSGEDAGTTLDRRFEALKNNPSQWNTNRFISDLRGQPLEVQNKYFGMVKDFAGQNQQWSHTMQNRLGNVAHWNRSSGAGEMWSNMIPGNLGVSTPKGGGQIGTGGLGTHQLNVTRGNFDTATRLQQFMGPGLPVGGVTANLENARVDEGDWPVVPHYGLLYRVQAQALSAGEK
jgi:hypothetical protein